MRGISRHSDDLNPQAEVLIGQIKSRAGNLYLTRQMLCAEAVVVTLNKALNGGLSDSQAVCVAAPFSIALGESGCICGALSGAVLACGLFIKSPQSHSSRKQMRESARQLHDQFKTVNGATCCRVLSQSLRHDRQARFQQCARFTAEAAGMTARVILHQRPELIPDADNGFLQKKETTTSAMFARLFQMVYRKL